MGTFGKVLKIVKARGGMALTAKIFNRPLNRNKKQRNDPDTDWLIRIRREFTILNDNPPVSFSAPLIMLPTMPEKSLYTNVVQMFELRETPEPVISIDDYPLGNITDANTADDEYVTAW